MSNFQKSKKIPRKHEKIPNLWYLHFFTNVIHCQTIQNQRATTLKASKIILTIILIYSFEVQADIVTFRSGKVVENVKTTIQKESVVIQYEEGRKETRPKAEIKSLKVRPVVWKLNFSQMLKKAKEDKDAAKASAEEKRKAEAAALAKAEEEEKERVAMASEKGSDFELRAEEDKISPAGNFGMGLIPGYSGLYRTKNKGAAITFSVLESIALLNLADIATAKRTRESKAEYLPLYFYEQAKSVPAGQFNMLSAFASQEVALGAAWWIRTGTATIGIEKGGITGRVLAGEQASAGRQDSVHKLNLGLSAGALLTFMLFDGIFSYLSANDWNEGSYSGEKSPGFIKPTTGWSRGVRSAFFPGYGQIYAGDKLKGGIYLFIGAALLIGAISAESEYSQAKKFYVREAFPLFYNSGMMDSLTGGKVNSLLIASSYIKPRRDKVEETEQKTNVLINSLICFWVFNVFDAVFFSGVDKPKISFRPDFRLGTAQNNGVLVYEPKIGATLTYSF